MGATYLTTQTINSITHTIVYATPRGWKADGSKRGVIVVPGTAETTKSGLTVATALPLINQILAAGNPVAFFQASLDANGIGTCWANDSCYGFFDAAKSKLASSYGAKSDKVITVGLSQGALDALAYAGKNPANVAAVQAYLPNTNIAATQANSSYTATVNSAYGGSYSDSSYGATHSPDVMRTNSTNPYTMPINLVYAATAGGDTSTDGVIPKSYPQGFADGVNGRTGASNVAMIFGGNTGHEWSVTTQAASIASLKSLLAANGA